MFLNSTDQLDDNITIIFNVDISLPSDKSTISDGGTSLIFYPLPYLLPTSKLTPISYPVDIFSPQDSLPEINNTLNSLSVPDIPPNDEISKLPDIIARSSTTHQSVNFDAMTSHF